MLLLLACIISRLTSSIYYLEDPDSMRFALAIKDFDLMNLQPHFPGYALFVFLVKCCYWVSGNVANSFSFIGGLSIFGVIFFCVKVVELLQCSVNKILLVSLIFFNPLFWLLSNRYMPDLAGVAFLMAAIYFLLQFLIKEKHTALLSYHLIAGLLIGVRLSFIPFLIIPSVYVFIFYPQKVKQALLFLIGTLIWFVPLLIDTGFENLIQVAKLQSNGHFNEWGETVITKSFYWLRFEKIVETIWADGLGGYLFNRGMITMFLSLFIILGFLVGVVRFGQSHIAKQKEVFSLLIAGLVSYFVWIYFYQNVIYKARHIIPFLPFVIILVALGISNLSKQNNIGKLVAISFVGMLGFFTIKLANQHKSKSAISQVGEFLNHQKNQSAIVIYTTELMHEFLSRSEPLDATYLEYNNSDNISVIDEFKSGKTIFATQNIDKLLGVKSTQVHKFYHNPYVNRAWSEVELYEYKN